MSSLSRTLLATSVIGSLTFAGYLWKDEQNQVDISFAQNDSDTPALIRVEAEDQAQLLATSLSPVSTAATDALFGESPVRSALAAQTTLASATTDNDAERPVVPGRRMTRAVERLAHGSPTEIVEVIVGLDQLENLDPELLASLDADVTTGFKRLPFASVRLPAGELHTLSEATGVRVIDVNAEVSAASVSARDTAGVPKRGSTQYWAASGDVAIAVIGSGVHPHADINLVRSIRCMKIGEDYLAARAAGEAGDVCNKSSNYDHFGHGTHIAGCCRRYGLALERTARRCSQQRTDRFNSRAECPRQRHHA